VGDAAGSPGGDVPEELAYDALGQVIRLDPALACQVAQALREPPVTAYHALQQALVGEVVGASPAPVPLTGGVDKGKAFRRALGAVPALEGRCQGFGDRRSHETAHREGLAVAYDRNSLIRRAQPVAGAHHPIHPPFT
jgi:hypothetical protein